MCYNVVTKEREVNKMICKCSKCNGTGKYFFGNGMVGHCYQCNGRGVVECVEKKRWAVKIVMDESGEKKNWLRVEAETEKQAIQKAKRTAKKGCYASYADTIEVYEDGIEYEYKVVKVR